MFSISSFKYVVVVDSLASHRNVKITLRFFIIICQVCFMVSPRTPAENSSFLRSIPPYFS